MKDDGKYTIYSTTQNLIGIQANINLTIDALRSELGCQIFNRVDNILLDAIGYR